MDTIDNQGVLIFCKQEYRFIISSLHLRIKHALNNQLKFDCYFFEIESDAAISLVVHYCNSCSSLKTTPKEVFNQSTGISPENIRVVGHFRVNARVVGHILFKMLFFSIFFKIFIFSKFGKN